MSSGRFHIEIGLATWGIGSAIASHYLAPAGTILLSSGFFTGVMWLSPDVDALHHRPCQNWGILKHLWIPYHATHGHRPFHWWKLFSKFSYRGHWPIIGSLERLLYVSLWIVIFGLPLGAMAISLYPLKTISLILQANWEMAAGAIAIFWAGNELASLKHIFCDYCPGVRHMDRLFRFL